MSEATTTSPPADDSKPAKPSTLPERITSIDAYRGFVMLLMMAEVLHFCSVAKACPGNGFWEFLCHHQTHVDWIGCSLHDLIQPSFSFLVGVALPFSIASRTARGQSRWQMTWHAAGRALVLVLLGVFLRSIGRPQINWTFEDTLSQIGLGYLFLFLLGFRPVRDQWIAFGVVVVGYWLAFAWYPLPGADFDHAAVGVPANWPHLMNGFETHWNKNSNLAWAFDTWFLNLFSREKVFRFNNGGYATLSFVPTLATMILGLIAGGVLRNERSPQVKAKWFAIAGVIGLVAGALIGWFGICPVVKRIWTPSWVVFSGGWCFLLLAAFYAIIDIAKFRKWSFPLVVIGMNSIAAYVMAHLFDGFIAKALKTFLGQNTFKMFGAAYEPFVHGLGILLVLWLLLYWMYRRKLLLRI